MRERGVQSTAGGRVEPGPAGAGRAAAATGGNVWQVLAIVALIAATAGWTTVAVLALRPRPPVAVASAEPVRRRRPRAVGRRRGPAGRRYARRGRAGGAPPDRADGTTLQAQSWTGDATWPTTPGARP